jgi:integrase
VENKPMGQQTEERADVGCDTGTIATVLGHADEKMATHYSGEADQRRRAKAAIVKLERTSEENGKLGRLC